MPKVLNKHRDGIPPGAVYIGRPTRWGNPYSIPKDGDRDSVIKQYLAYIYRNPDLMRAAQTELRGRDLVCWCAPLECHGDVLLEIVNASQED